MRKILVDGGEKEFTKESLPILIHGEEGSGASLYTVSLSANFYQQGFSILFLCGFSMAEEEFSKQMGVEYGDKARFFTKDRVDEFKKILVSENTGNAVIVIKNIELFGEDVFDLVADKQSLIISGDINESGIKNKIVEKAFTTKIYFSPFENTELPALNKYEGFVIGDDYKGISSLA